MTTLHDHAVYGNVTFRNDHGLHAGYDDQFHRPYDNWRVSAGPNFFVSDFYRGFDLTWATGEFELTEYHELIASKRFKFWEPR